MVVSSTAAVLPEVVTRHVMPRVPRVPAPWVPGTCLCPPGLLAFSYGRAAGFLSVGMMCGGNHVAERCSRWTRRVRPDGCREGPGATPQLKSKPLPSALSPWTGWVEWVHAGHWGPPLILLGLWVSRPVPPSVLRGPGHLAP